MEYLQWHPAFVANLKAGFGNEREELELESEHNLSKKPMQIDVLVKKKADRPTKWNIGKLFRGHNIIEYKGPVDYLSIDDYYKVYGYACFYKAETEKENEIPAKELTITFVCRRYPRKLIAYLREVKKYVVTEEEPGIYYVFGDELPIQIIVTSRLSEESNFWLKYLTNDLTDVETAEKIVEKYKKHQNDELYKSMMNVIVNANRDLFEEVKYMCEALRELFREDMERELAKGLAEGIERGMAEGRAEGRRESLRNAVRNLMSNLALTMEQAMDALGIPAEERTQYI